MFTIVTNGIKNLLIDSFTKPKKNISAKRIEFIDLAKGICILLVVLVHLTFIEFPGSKQIRMPLYFLLSGLFYKNYGKCYKGLIIKKTNKIFIPFLFFITISLLSYVFVDVITKSSTISESLSDLIGNGDLHKILFKANGAIWFLLCLFWANIIFCIITTSTKNEYLVFIIVSSIGVIGNIIDNRFGILFWTISTMRALPFFYLGYLLKRTALLYPNKFDKLNLPLGLLLLAVCVIISIYGGNPHIEFSKNYSVNSVILFYIAAVFGVIGLLFICKWINWLPMVSYIGRFSIIVLGLHLPLFHIIRASISDASFSQSWVKIVVAIVYMLLLWCSIPLFRHLFPKLCAQKDLITL